MNRARQFRGGQFSLLYWALLVTVWFGSQAIRGQPPAASGAQDNAWMQAPPASTGIAVGQKIPSFSLSDQNGKTQTFDSIKGPNGAAIYFMRSADW